MRRVFVILTAALAVGAAQAAESTAALAAARTERGATVTWTTDERMWFVLAGLGLLLAVAFFWARGREKRAELYPREINPERYGGEGENPTPL